MKKNLFFTLLTSLLVSSCELTAQFKHQFNQDWSNKVVKANGNYVTKTIYPRDFNHIVLQACNEVEYTQQPGKPAVEVYTSENILEVMDIKVKGATLYIGWKEGYNVRYNDLTVRINSAALQEVNILGSGEFDFKNGLESDQLKLSVAGSGSIEGNGFNCTRRMECSIAGSGSISLEGLQTPKIDTSIAGSGEMELKGAAEKAAYDIAGSGEMECEDLEVQNMYVSIAGSGDVTCFAVKTLKVDIGGSGNVRYKGNPELDVPKRGVRKL